MDNKLLPGLLLASAFFALPLAALAGAISANGGDGSDGGHINIRCNIFQFDINLNANGGHGRNGGNLSFQDKDAEFEYIKDTWTFRALDDSCLQYPEYVSSQKNKNSKLLIAKIETGQSATGSNKANIIDWYTAFKELLINNFHPVVRGGIGSRIKIHKGQVQDIEYFGYNPAIPFFKDEMGHKTELQPVVKSDPEQISADEKALRANVSETISKTAQSLASAFPADAQDVTLKFIFAGDPRGKNFWWTSYFLLDKANYKNSDSAQ